MAAEEVLYTSDHAVITNDTFPDAHGAAVVEVPIPERDGVSP